VLQGDPWLDIMMASTWSLRSVQLAVVTKSFSTTPESPWSWVQSNWLSPPSRDAKPWASILRPSMPSLIHQDPTVLAMAPLSLDGWGAGPS